MKQKIFSLILFCCSAVVFSQSKKALLNKKYSSNQKGKTEIQNIQKKEIPVNEDYEKAMELFQLNKPKEAIPFFEKAFEDENVNPEIYNHLSICYYQIGDYTRSLACATKGLTQKDTNHKILAFNAGNSAWALGNYARAESCYSIAIKEDETFAPAFLNKANSQLKQDKLQEAKETYTKYLEIDKENPQKEEIVRLLALLDEEIIRRQNEKPEIIDLDFANVKNEDVIVEKPLEKVQIEEIVSEDKIDENYEELVILDDDLNSKNIIQFQKIENDNEPKKIEEDLKIEEFKTEKKAEITEKVNEDFLNNSENFSPVNEEKIASEKEIFEEENLPDALITLPAGSISIKPLTFAFSPNSQNSKFKKEQFSVEVSDKENISEYTFEIIDSYGNTVNTLKGKKLPSILEWDGKTSSLETANGRYTSKLTVQYKNGGTVSKESSAFNCFTTPPKVSISPENNKFSPDGDGVNDLQKFSVKVESDTLIETLEFEVEKNNKVIYKEKFSGSPKDFSWDGKTSDGKFVKDGDELNYKVSVTDSFDVKTTAEAFDTITKSKRDPVVSKNVEVNKNEDGTVDIYIPTLSFKINSFELVATSKNEDTIQKVYNILVDEQYEDFDVLITGFINPDAEKWTKEEEILALKRAESVENYLKELGIPSTRMKSQYGSGKTKNKEFNRRVEFKLIKK